MFYDLEYKKRFPAIYALINNKKYEGYDYLFKKIKNIITLENTRQIKIKSFSILKVYQKNIDESNKK